MLPSSSASHEPSSVRHPVLVVILALLGIGALRMRKPAGDRTGEPPPLGDSLEFFLMSQSAIDTARVNRDAKALCDSIGQLRTGDSPLGCPDLRHKLHQLGGQLVPGSWPPFLWQQAGEASFLKRCLRLIERRTREAERFCCLADRFLVDLHLTQHL